MSRKTNDEFIAEMKEQHPDITLLEEYHGYYKEIRVRHSCGCEYMITPQDLSRKQADGCPNCKSPRKSHEQFVSEMAKINPNVEVIGTYIKKAKPVKIRFKDCGHSYDANATALLKGHGCKYCANNAVLQGFNDIATTAHWMVDYLVNKEDATKYSCNSHMKIWFKCPECGREKLNSIQSVYRYGICCQYCGDGLSYPNKFGRALFMQLPVENYQPEYEEKWSNHKRYDNYFEYKGKKYVVEMDGGFHYKSTDFGSLEEAEAIDQEKDKLAEEHGIIMIRIDCRESNMDYITKNIKESKLSGIFDLSQVDWNECNKQAASNLAKEVCLFFEANKNQMLPIEIAKHFNISMDTLRRYRKTGEDAGWCTPIKKEELERGYHIKSSRKKIPINIYDINKKLITTTKSVKQCISYMKENFGIAICDERINKQCKTPEVPYEGYYFEYANVNNYLSDIIRQIN